MADPSIRLAIRKGRGLADPTIRLCHIMGERGLADPTSRLCHEMGERGLADPFFRLAT
jgi:hypothetical protein